MSRQISGIQRSYYLHVYQGRASVTRTWCLCTLSTSNGFGCAVIPHRTRSCWYGTGARLTLDLFPKLLQCPVQLPVLGQQAEAELYESVLGLQAAVWEQLQDLQHCKKPWLSLASEPWHSRSIALFHLSLLWAPFIFKVNIWFRWWGELVRGGGVKDRDTWAVIALSSRFSPLWKSRPYAYEGIYFIF